jgi:predicted NAD/FAD-binding protein
LLADPTPAESAVLGAFGYAANQTVLHTDPTVLPQAPGARASWNYLLPSCRAGHGQVLVSYDLNRLQRLAEPVRYLVTLNATDRIPVERMLARMTYRHPMYTVRSVRAQRRLGDLTSGVIAYAGAYHGWGFHEDGARSGVAAAAAFGAPW